MKGRRRVCHWAKTELSPDQWRFCALCLNNWGWGHVSTFPFVVNRFCDVLSLVVRPYVCLLPFTRCRRLVNKNRRLAFCWTRGKCLCLQANGDWGELAQSAGWMADTLLELKHWRGVRREVANTNRINHCFNWSRPNS
jgi:hypothetical protein